MAPRKRRKASPPAEGDPALAGREIVAAEPAAPAAGPPASPAAPAASPAAPAAAPAASPAAPSQGAGPRPRRRGRKAGEGGSPAPEAPARPTTPPPRPAAPAAAGPAAGGAPAAAGQPALRGQPEPAAGGPAPGRGRRRKVAPATGEADAGAAPAAAGDGAGRKPRAGDRTAGRPRDGDRAAGKAAGGNGAAGGKRAAGKPAGGKSGSGRTRIVFLGGVGEIGRNMTVFEHDGKMLIIDTGLMFPTEEMLGVDLVLPDFSYVRERADQVIGMVLTHAHEDHIGGIPYLLRDVNPPIYGTRLTLGLLRNKLEEHRLADSARLKEIKAGGRLTLGPFRLRFLQVAHSIPGCVAIVITTDAGTVLFTGDWKLDPTPVDGKPTDVAGIAEVGREGVDLLLSDSTNALVPGHLPSERSAGEAIREVVRRASGRVVIACFASNIHRVQQILRAADENSRMVAFIGRSMVRNVQVASELGYLEVPPGIVVSVEEAARHPGSRVVIVCTGSQGEPLSALSLMAVKEHRHIELTDADTVVFSATPIPGNESAVRRVIDGLSRIGVEVIAPPGAAVHVSGHAASGELRTMLSLVRPAWFIPVHGEYRMLKAHARIAQETGVPPERMLLVEDGASVEMGKGKVKLAEPVQAGYVFVDGLGIGDVEDVVLRDRRLLAADGILVCVLSVDRATGEVIAGPDLISRGFVVEGQAASFYEDARAALRASMDSVAREELADWAALRRHTRRSLGKFVWSRTGRRPIILPVVVEV
jgi:ribonuclease J